MKDLMKGHFISILRLNHVREQGFGVRVEIRTNGQLSLRPCDALTKGDSSIFNIPRSLREASLSAGLRIGVVQIFQYLSLYLSQTII